MLVKTALRIFGMFEDGNAPNRLILDIRDFGLRNFIAYVHVQRCQLLIQIDFFFDSGNLGLSIDEFLSFQRYLFERFFNQSKQ